MLCEMKTNFPVLTSLRGLAAWAVVFYHFRLEIGLDHWPALQSMIGWGYLAVDLFFIMSGFVIALTAGSRLRRPQWRTAVQFWGFRLARIYPLHLIVLLAMLINPVAIHVFSATHGVDQRYDPAYFLQSLVLVQNWGFTTRLAWNVPAWSISTEWAAYLCFPALAWLVGQVVTTRERACILILGTLMVAGLLGQHWGGLGADIPKDGLPRCIMEFTLGVLVHQLWALRGTWRWSGDLVMGAGLMLVVLGAVMDAPDYAFAPAAFVLLVGGALQDGALPRALTHRALVVLGEVSFSTYIAHYFVRDWVKFVLIRPAIPMPLAFIAYVMLTALASVVLYRWVELPSRAASRRLILAALDRPLPIRPIL